MQLAGTFLFTVWGLCAMYLVWGVKRSCPPIYVGAFGGMAAVLYFAVNEVPEWLHPLYIPTEFGILASIIGGGAALFLLDVILQQVDEEDDVQQSR